MKIDDLMEAPGQKQFIQKIKTALQKNTREPAEFTDRFSHPPSTDDLKILNRIHTRSEEESVRLLERLMAQAQPINLQVSVCRTLQAVTENIYRLVLEKKPEWGDQKSLVAWRHPLIEKLNLPEALARENIPVYFPDSKDPNGSSVENTTVHRERLRSRVIDAYIGVTAADFCMADTATLVMRTRPEQPRTISLVPSIHVAVIELHQIIADLKELYLLLKRDPKESIEGLTNCMTFISGPSKTADIEATMVHGAHGPREVHLYVLAE